MHPLSNRRPVLSALFGIVALTFSVASGSPLSAQSAQAAVQRTTRIVHWTWDPASALGVSTLVRTERGIAASFQASELPAGQAITMWFIVFNNPAACATSPCGPGDLGNPAVQGDFLWAAGHIVGASGKASFAGRLAIGDTSGSGFIELGLPEAAVGLLDPLNAEVQLALHSHGPALSGQDLKAQITSFTGGCATFLGGADGIADGPGDLPANVGECSTFQVSVHR